jgi:tryptophan synthase alpha chain
MSAGSIEASLRRRRDAGQKGLVPYVTGGMQPDWLDVVRALADAGADAIEVGIPFSDPVMDGPVIQQASEQALTDGATPQGLIDALSGVDAGVPIAVMTYYNPVMRAGEQRFASSLASAGIAGAIVPDLPLEELDPWEEAAGQAEIETILLAAPTADDARLQRICDRASGFVYGVGLLGVTGERSELAESATTIAGRLKPLTDLPVLVGVGVSTSQQAVQVCEVSDGVVVGSALVRRLLEGCGPIGAARFVAELRQAMDGAHR